MRVSKREASRLLAMAKPATVQNTNGARGMSAAIPARNAQKPQPGTMNKTEVAFAFLLDFWVRQGLVTGYGYECMRLKVNDTCWYTPDFFVQLATGEAMLVEVKAWRHKGKDDPTPFYIIQEDSRVKMHAVEAMYPFPVLLACGRCADTKNQTYEWVVDWVADHGVMGEDILLNGLRRKGVKPAGEAVLLGAHKPESGELPP